MRRLTVVQLLPALSSGGVERSTLETAQALVRAGHRSVVVSAGGRLVAELEATGSTHVVLDIGRKSATTVRQVLPLRRLLKQWQPDIVHARSRLPAWLGWLALKRARLPHTHFLTTVHGLNSPGAYSRILTRGERVVCVSETVRAHVLRQWPQTPPERLLVIEPGIDPREFSAGGPAHSGSGTRLLMPGRGTRLKGHAAAIELLAGLRAAGVDAQLSLLGARESGREAYLAELEALATELGVAGQLAIEAPTAQVLEAYRNCDLVLQLSAKPEAYGRTVVEALSVGKPVVGWDHGGVGELLARHFPEGRVAKGDPQALLATTLRLLAEARRPGPVHAQTLAAMQAQTLGLYESIAG